VEIGETQARDVAEVLRDAGWTAVAIEQDLTGRDRVVVASRAR
jgi:methylase of polypeptide subunit release factors